MSARKLGLLLLLLAFGGAIEGAWNLRGDLRFGPEGCRVVGGHFYGPSFTFEQTTERPVSAASARIEVSNAFGDVRVTAGQAGVVKVRLRKVVFRPTQEQARTFADRIELQLSGDPSLLRVGTNREQLDREQDVGFETHLELEAPPDAILGVHNQHGRVDLSGVAGAEVVSSFDEVNVAQLTRDLTIESRHGDVNVERVAGRLELSSRHGNVSLKRIAGGGKLELQHGDLTAADSGALTVTLQHGQLRASVISGDLVVRAGHAELDVSDVAGSADVETSFAPVQLLRIGGSARARVEHGRVSAEDVRGGASVETSYDGIQLERVEGPVVATVHHGGVEGKGLAQGARVRASGADVDLQGFSGAVEVVLDRGNARLSPHAAIAAPIVVTVAHGEARLELPEGSRVDLDAESRRGELHAELGALARERDEKRPARRLAARLGGGGPEVRVRADGDVTLESRPAEAITEKAVAEPERAGTAEAGDAAPAPRPARATPALPAEKAEDETAVRRKP